MKEKDEYFLGTLLDMADVSPIDEDEGVHAMDFMETDKLDFLNFYAEKSYKKGEQIFCNFRLFNEKVRASYVYFLKYGKIIDENPNEAIKVLLLPIKEVMSKSMEYKKILVDINNSGMGIMLKDRQLPLKQLKAFLKLTVLSDDEAVVMYNGFLSKSEDASDQDKVADYIIEHTPTGIQLNSDLKENIMKSFKDPITEIENKIEVCSFINNP